MSRNFELMTQLEIEAGITDKATSTAADQAAKMAVVPILIKPRRRCRRRRDFTPRPAHILVGQWKRPATGRSLRG